MVYIVITLQELPRHLLQTLASFCKGEHLILQKEVNNAGIWSFTEVELIPCLWNFVDSHFACLSTT